jgi:hypothetical protein
MNIDPTQMTLGSLIVLTVAFIGKKVLYPLWRKFTGKGKPQAVNLHVGYTVTDEKGTVKQTEFIINHSEKKNPSEVLECTKTS